MCNSLAMEKNTKAMNFAIPRSVHTKLTKLAYKNGRSVSGEARFALAQYATKEKL